MKQNEDKKKHVKPSVKMLRGGKGGKLSYERRAVSGERWVVSSNTWAMSNNIWAINPNLVKTHGFRVYNQNFDKLIVYF